MSVTATIEAFLDIVRRSAVLDAEQLARYVEGLRRSASLPARAEDLAQLLIRDGYLTRFQTQQFLAGRWQGLMLGKYQLLEQIGQGRSGSVYLGKHPKMNRPVAIKVLPPAREGSTTFRRFEREARAGARLDHPHIVKMFDFDHDEGVYFLVMEYVEGVNLRNLVKQSGPLDPCRAAHYIRQAALGLQHLHEAGLIHRDIEPANLLLDRQGILKILDLGLARFESDSADQLTMQQGAKLVLGTVDYMAPEQISDSHGVDIRGDIYALGGTFYYLLAGHPPFPDVPVIQKLMMAQSREPTALRELRPDVPIEMSALVERMMKKNPAERPQQAKEVAEALYPWTRTPVPPPTEHIPRRGEAGLDSSARGRPRLVIPPPRGPSRTLPVAQTLLPPPPTRRAGLFWPLTFLFILLAASTGLGVAFYVSVLSP
jgi:serine/threonine protein kinase